MTVQSIEIGDVLDDAAGKLRNLANKALSDSGPSCWRFLTRLPSAFAVATLFVVIIRLALRSRMRRTALQLARIGAHLKDQKARVHWELAKLLLPLEREDLSVPERRQRDAGLLAALRAASESGDPLIRAAAEVAYAEALYRSSRYDEALELADRAHGRASEQARWQRTKANILVANGRFAEGHTLYAGLLAKQPSNTELQRKSELLAQLTQSTPRPVAEVAGGDNSEISVLIGVGGGIGDLLHTTPMIRNIAQRTGGPVDVLVLGDHAGTEFLFNNPKYVNRVWALSADVLARRYKTVFLTHSFGPMRFPFNAECVSAARDWRTFRPGSMHETLFNLEAAKRGLGIAYDETDATGYFAGTLKYQPPAKALIGFHAGSKHGRWLSKRWPHFAELGARLVALGIPIASFGAAEEYVAGTENRTGGTIEEMSQSMLDCTLFISNDSGPMHIANALGIPVLTVFAPTDAMTHLPLRPGTVALALQKRCSPCEIKNHPFFASGRCRCIAEISVDEVEQNLTKMRKHLLAPQAAIAATRHGSHLEMRSYIR